MFLQAFDALGNGGLGDVQLGRRRAETLAFDGQIKKFELIEIHQALILC
jgi:hypothetical protein